jgi:hypothetical protein
MIASLSKKKHDHMNGRGRGSTVTGGLLQFLSALAAVGN